jgi:hypothetical protein
MTLRVTVEIVPFGQEDKKYEIGRLDIFNKGRVDFDHCEYGILEFNVEKDDFGMYDKTVLHRRNLGAWKLIEKVIRELDVT